MYVDPLTVAVVIGSIFTGAVLAIVAIFRVRARVSHDARVEWESLADVRKGALEDLRAEFLQYKLDTDHELILLRGQIQGLALVQPGDIAKAVWASAPSHLTREVY